MIVVHSLAARAAADSRDFTVLAELGVLTGLVDLVLDLSYFGG